MSFIVISAGLAYFLALPFASLLQGGGYHLGALLRAKRHIAFCLAYFALSSAAETAVCLLAKGVGSFVLTICMYACTGLFVFCMHRSMRLEIHFTRRLIRSLIVFLLLYLAIYVGLFFTTVKGLWATTPATAPFVLALSSVIMNPIEKAKNKRYVDRAAKRLALMPALKIGITGSYGKTSVKRYLEQILSLRFKTLASPENYNTPLGLAKTVETASDKEQVLILEMGARRQGDIRELCDMVKPDLGIITGIAPQHLETFGSLENVISEKGRLGESVAADKCVFYNLTDPHVRKMYQSRKGKKIGVGYENADYVISDTVFGKSGSAFTLSKGEELHRFSLPCVGLASVVNVSLAVAVAVELGVPWECCVAAAYSLYAPAHRFEVVRSGDITVIDDSYNVNPVGAEVALESLAMFAGERKIVYTSGIVEGGKQEKEINRSLGRKIAEVASIVLVAEGRYGDAVVQGLENGKTEVIRVKNTDEASTLFGELLKKGDVLLIMSDLPRDYLL